MSRAEPAMDSLAFFHHFGQHCDTVLEQAAGRAVLIDALLAGAWQSFDANVQAQCEGLPELDCHKGCATCCTLRVSATAPEVLMLARFIRAVHPALMERGIDLPAQVAKADACTQGLAEPDRVAARQRCPFIAQGVCVIYQVRPLACRGLASYDKRACAQAASGKIDEIPYSEPHMRMRSLVQNAMQSSLRDAGLAWASYELNHSLTLALQDETTESRWLVGEDPFAAAQLHDVDVREMAQTFDALKALSV
jgi:Fe-S-cluster containining protein